MQLSVRVLWVTVGLVVACGAPPWPVPVPPSRGTNGEPQRAEAPLPLCGGGSKTCPERAAIEQLVTAHAARCAGVTDRAEMPADLVSLLDGLSENAVSPREFPRHAAPLPDAFRAQPGYPAVDSAEPSPSDSSAVLFKGLWWTFWDRAGLTEEPVRNAGYSYLVVFPEFEGRDGCKDW